MTPDDVALVRQSWRRLRVDGEALQARIAHHLMAESMPVAVATRRAEWLVRAMDHLVHLLPAPSRLSSAAHAECESCPDTDTAPCSLADGRAWVGALRDLPGWSPADEHAWQQAWVLLADVLAAETLSPFSQPS